MNDETLSRPRHGKATTPPWRNLPVIWSHCLAGAWLGGYWPGAERWDRLSILLVAASACYIGRNFLAGRWQEAKPANAKWSVAWPVLLYPLANAVSSQRTLAAAVGEGLLVGTYVFGSSILAREESVPDDRRRRWPWLLLVLPIIVNAAWSARFGPGHLIVVVLPAFWLARVALGRTSPLGIDKAAALRAGGILADLSAVVACAAFLPWLGWFAILFVLALLSQRLTPAG